MMNMTPVVKQLLIINIIFFIGSNYVGDYAYELFSMYYPENSHFQFWQPLTHMFMHAKYPMLSHIAFNMLGLVMFGSPLENFWGAKKFLFFYISCGLGAVLIQTGINYLEMQNVYNELANLNLSSNELHKIFNFDIIDGNFYSTEKLADNLNLMAQSNVKINSLNQQQLQAIYNGIIQSQTPMVGASGAIYGLLVAFAFMFPNAELMLLFIPFPVKAKYFVPVLVGLDLFSGVTGFSLFGGGIAHFAHVGGALVGFLMMWYWRNNKFKHNRWN